MSTNWMQLEACEICQSSGHIRGIFHVMVCAGCNGAGLQRVGGGAVDCQDLVVQLRLRLTDAERQRNQYRERLDRAGLLHCPRQDNNRRGPGGSHMTLD